MTIIEKIDKLREERGWSVNYLAMEAMLTQSTLNNLYARNTEPKISTLRAICGAFNMTLSEFFADENLEGPVTDDYADELQSRYMKLTEAQKKAVISLLRSMT
ncbi:MAG: helix-turn-helix domain-containing protein [Clostridia bacterium]|nr:helix-turn-helix domain-containing protein [Clostridia bacterium]